ncbi:MAG: AAA family ATPase [Halothermotrichaceae bacterium]
MENYVRERYFNKGVVREMKIKSIAGENFRLLTKMSQNRVMLDDKNTIIVGRNNCGKTSFIELVKCFTTKDNPSFDFADFSISSLSNFDSSYKSYKKYRELKNKDSEEDEEKIVEIKEEFENKLPIIKLEIVIIYTDDDNTAHLEPFITELKSDNKEVILQYEYYCEKAESFFNKYERLYGDSKTELREYIKDNYCTFYKTRIWTIDSTNRENKHLIEKKKTWKEDLNRLLKTAFIFARRELDDKAEDKSKELSKLFDSYFKLVQNDDEKLLTELTKVLGTASGNWDEKYDDIFEEYFEDLNNFGYPGLEDRNIELKSKFSPDSILKNNTDIFYSNNSGYNLPEAYNGLGFSNLIYIILKLLYFYKEFQIERSRLQMINCS